MNLPNYAAFFSAAFFFAAHRFFIAMDRAFRPASVRPPFLTGTGLFASVALGVTATGAGPAAAAFADLMAAAQRSLFPPAFRPGPCVFSLVVGPCIASIPEGSLSRWV